jgi:hypothetical protein
MFFGKLRMQKIFNYMYKNVSKNNAATIMGCGAAEADTALQTR